MDRLEFTLKFNKKPSKIQIVKGLYNKMTSNSFTINYPEIFDYEISFKTDKILTDQEAFDAHVENEYQIEVFKIYTYIKNAALKDKNKTHYLVIATAHDY